MRYPREHNITQIVLGHSSRSRVQEFLHGSVVNTLTRELRAIDILVVAAPAE